MNESLRIAVAVLLGLVVTVGLSAATDFLMARLGIFPADGDAMNSQRLLVLASVYRAIFGVVGAFVASIVAREKFMRAVLILGVVGMVAGLVGIFAMWREWNGATGWYPISLAVLAIPYCLIGGRLYARYKSVKS